MSQALQKQTSLSIRELGARLALPASSLRRWRRRQRDECPLVQAPGPKKLQPLPVQQLQEQIRALHHGPKRTCQTGPLFEEFAEAISRRDLAGLVRTAREEAQLEKRLRLVHVEWRQTNVAWAIDATQTRAPAGPLNLIATRELTSHFFLSPSVSLRPDGAWVAQHLRQLFQREDPPLLLKRDNGSIFNAAPVNAVLAEFGVIPLNSPPYYPPYNGAIENGIRELKHSWLAVLPQPLPPSLDFLAKTAEAIAHQRNCLPRRSLAGRSAAQTFYAQPLRFSRRERQEIFQWLYARWSGILLHMEKVNRCFADALWRDVVVGWLRCQHLIDLTINPKLLPHSAPFCAHN
jgi:transposase InsO family protein